MGYIAPEIMELSEN